MLKMMGNDKPAIKKILRDQNNVIVTTPDAAGAATMSRNSEPESMIESIGSVYVTSTNLSPTTIIKSTKFDTVTETVTKTVVKPLTSNEVSQCYSATTDKCFVMSTNSNIVKEKLETDSVLNSNANCNFMPTNANIFNEEFKIDSVIGDTMTNSGCSIIATDIKKSCSTSSWSCDEKEKNCVIEAKLQDKRPYNSSEKSTEFNVAETNVCSSLSTNKCHCYLWSSVYNDLDSSQNNAATEFEFKKDELWDVIQTNYSFIMDTQLLDICQETQYEIENEATAEVFKSHDSSLDETNTNEHSCEDVRGLRKWLREMDKKLSKAPTLSQATHFSCAELQRQQAKFSLLYQEIVSHAQMISVCIRAATEREQQHQEEQKQQQNLKISATDEISTTKNTTDGDIRSKVTNSLSEAKTVNAETNKATAGAHLTVGDTAATIIKNSKRSLERLENRYHLLYLKAFEIKLFLEDLLMKNSTTSELNDNIEKDYSSDAYECSSVATENDLSDDISKLESHDEVNNNNSLSFCDLGSFNINNKRLPIKVTSSALLVTDESSDNCEDWVYIKAPSVITNTHATTAVGNGLEYPNSSSANSTLNSAILFNGQQSTTTSVPIAPNVTTTINDNSDKENIAESTHNCSQKKQNTFCYYTLTGVNNVSVIPNAQPLYSVQQQMLSLRNGLASRSPTKSHKCKSSNNDTMSTKSNNFPQESIKQLINETTCTEYDEEINMSCRHKHTATRKLPIVKICKVLTPGPIKQRVQKSLEQQTTSLYKRRQNMLHGSNYLRRSNHTDGYEAADEESETDSPATSKIRKKKFTSSTRSLLPLAVKKLDSLSSPGSFEYNKAKTITQSAVVSTADQASQKRRRNAFRVRRKLFEDLSDKYSSSLNLSLFLPVNTSTPKRQNVDKFNHQQLTDAFKKKLDFDNNKSTQSIRRSCVSVAKRKPHKVNKGSSVNLKNVSKEGITPINYNIPDDNKVMLNILKQGCNCSENIGFHPTSFEVVNACRDNTHYPELVLQRPSSTVLSTQCIKQTKDILDTGKKLLIWSENEIIVQQLQMEMIILKHGIWRLGNRSSFELSDIDEALQSAIEALQNEKSQLQNFDTSIQCLNSSVNSWLAKGKRIHEAALFDQDLVESSVKEVAENKILIDEKGKAQSEETEIALLKSANQTTTLAALKLATVEITVSDNIDNKLRALLNKPNFNQSTALTSVTNTATLLRLLDLCSGESGCPATQPNIDQGSSIQLRIATRENTTTNLGDQWAQYPLMKLENKFYKQLMDELIDMHRAWKEANESINSTKIELKESVKDWRVLKTDLIEFHAVLEQNHNALIDFKNSLEMSGKQKALKSRTFKRKNKRKQRNPNGEKNAANKSSTSYKKAVVPTAKVRALRAAPVGAEQSDNVSALEFDIGASNKEGNETNTNIWTRRIVRSVLPVLCALFIIIFCIVCVLLSRFQDNCNNFFTSFGPQLRYVHGPPPI